MTQKHLVLILARELADKLASAVFLVDHEANLVYFNERAGVILGQEFAQTGPLPRDAWAKAFFPSDMEGQPLAAEELPVVVAVTERRPVHRAFRIQGMDGVTREISVTGVPLFAHREEFVGAAAIFWEGVSGQESRGDR